MISNHLSIAFASGKGGTGKTAVSANFSRFLSQQYTVCLLDLDVEEPNIMFYFSEEQQYPPNTADTSCESTMLFPEFNPDSCTNCGVCVDKCRNNALILKTKGPILFQELCKGCSRCAISCEKKAVVMISRRIGTIQRYSKRNLVINEGLLDPGNIHTRNLIANVKQIKRKGITIIDCPPGTTCPMVEAIKDSDYVFLITEPTPFGLHDLTLAVEVVQKLKKPFGIILNKSDSHDEIIEEYCRQNNLPIITKIPYTRETAEKCASGTLCYTDPGMKKAMQSLHDQIEELAE